LAHGFSTYSGWIFTSVISFWREQEILPRSEKGMLAEKSDSPPASGKWPATCGESLHHELWLKLG
jgi:hypothetical protein